jgi:hypothetical protein
MDVWHEDSIMRMRIIFGICCAMLCDLGGVPACAETAVDGRIVRVVYQFTTGGNWGFHLANMKDGRYCVRFGNPGRLTLRIMDRAADICFDTMPASVEHSGERRSQAFDVREKGKRITVVSYHKGSIAAGGSDITLDIATCNRIDGEEVEAHCGSTRYVVHMDGATCAAEILPDRGRNRISTVTCEHYAAE